MLMLVVSISVKTQTLDLYVAATLVMNLRLVESYVQVSSTLILEPLKC